MEYSSNTLEVGSKDKKKDNETEHALTIFS